MTFKIASWAFLSCITFFASETCGRALLFKNGHQNLHDNKRQISSIPISQIKTIPSLNTPSNSAASVGPVLTKISSSSLLRASSISSTTLSMSAAQPQPTISFLSTTIQVPIATVCPANSASGPQSTSPVFPTLTVFPPTVSSAPSVSILRLITASVTISLLSGRSSVITSIITPTVQPTVVLTTPKPATILPGGVTALPAFGANDNLNPAAARIVLDNSGCQTLYAPTATAICHTVVSPVGIPPVTITDCAQMVTLSSETGCGCIATPNPIKGSGRSGDIPTTGGNVIPVSIPSVGQLTRRQVAGISKPSVLPISISSASLPSTSLWSLTRSNVPTFSISSPIVSPIPVSTIDDLFPQPLPPVTFYQALWHSIAAGGVPQVVEAVVCYGGLSPGGECSVPDTDGDTEACECSTQTENWSVSTVTRIRVGTTIASFSGPAYLTYGSLTVTTSFTFATPISTTQTAVYPTVIKTPVSVSLLPIPTHMPVPISSSIPEMPDHSMTVTNVKTGPPTIATLTLTLPTGTKMKTL